MNENIILRVHGLEVDFQTSSGFSPALRGASFELNRGEVLALVGKSGSGKTACARSILRLLPQNGRVRGGEVLYGGQDLLRLSEKKMCELRGAHIGMVFQDPMAALDPVMKIGAQIAEAVRRTEHLHKKAALSRACELLNEVGIARPAERAGDYPFQLSGGMRQRVIIAIALAMRPQILICDEPTSALDATVQARILELLCEAGGRHGFSLIFITHSLGVAAGIADRIAVMHKGRIAEIETAERIFYSPTHEATRELLDAARGIYAGLE